MIETIAALLSLAIVLFACHVLVKILDALQGIRRDLRVLGDLDVPRSKWVEGGTDGPPGWRPSTKSSPPDIPPLPPAARPDDR